MIPESFMIDSKEGKQTIVTLSYEGYVLQQRSAWQNIPVGR